MHNPLGFSLFIRSSHYHHFLVLEHYYYPNGKSSNNKQSLSIRFSPHPLPNTYLLSVSIDLPILDISCKWNHTTCGLLCVCVWLLSLSVTFSKHINSVSTFHSFSWLDNILLNGSPIFVYPFITWWLWVFPLLAILNNVTMNIPVSVFVWTLTSFFLTRKIRSFLSFFIAFFPTTGMPKTMGTLESLTRNDKKWAATFP